jgi:hypothetical protein
MVRVPHHDPEHGGSIFLTTLSLSMGRRVRVRQAHPTSKYPEEDRGAMSLSNRSNRQVERQYALYVGAEMNFPYPLNGLSPNPRAKTSGTG